MNIELSCGCIIEIFSKGVELQKSKLCGYHLQQANSLDVIINFHNWFVDRVNDLKNALESSS